MVDFRYHALSLVAVFLALGIGIVLGVTVGDSLVSEADQNLRDSLRDDVTEARQEARDEQELGTRRDEVIDASAKEIADGRLQGYRIALVAVDELPAEVADAVEEAVEMGGAKLVRTAQFKQGPEVEIQPPENPGPEVPLRTQERAQRNFGAQLAQLAESGRAAAPLLARELPPEFFSGSLSGPVDAVALYRQPPPEDESEEDRALHEAFTDGIFRPLRNSGIAVEAFDTDPSQVGWYDDHEMASVDNVDGAAGQLALVVLLQEAVLADITGERPEGSYGYKDTADQAIPDLSD